MIVRREQAGDRLGGSVPGKIIDVIAESSL